MAYVRQFLIVIRSRDVPADRAGERDVHLFANGYLVRPISTIYRKAMVLMSDSEAVIFVMFGQARRHFGSPDYSVERLRLKGAQANAKTQNFGKRSNFA
jgi:hypothetical protein